MFPLKLIGLFIGLCIYNCLSTMQSVYTLFTLIFHMISYRFVVLIYLDVNYIVFENVIIY